MAIVLFLTPFNVRIDYLRVPRYLKCHWKFYACHVFVGLGSALAYWAFWLAIGYGMLPSITNTHKHFLCSSAIGVNFILYGIQAVLFSDPTRLRSLLGSPARTLKASEIFQPLLWAVETITLGFCLWCTDILPWGDVPVQAGSDVWNPFVDVPLDHKISFWLGNIIALGSLFIKFCSVYTLGINPYYYRDIWTNMPESTFVCEFPYGVWWLPHPQYGVGKASILGASIRARSTVAVCFSVCQLIWMNLVLAKVEEGFVKRMYCEAHTKAIEDVESDAVTIGRQDEVPIAACGG